MNKLLNVSRTEGFPWCAEAAEAMNENVRYIEAIMDGILLSKKGGEYGNVAIILSIGTYTQSYIYINIGRFAPKGNIVRTKTNISIFDTNTPTIENLVNNPGKYTLIDRSETISINKQNSDSEVYQDCITEELYEIALADSNNPGWRFYRMESFFQQKSWKDVSLSQLMLPAQFNMQFKNGSKFRYDIFNNVLDIQLDITHNAVFMTDESIFVPVAIANEISIPANIHIPLTAGQYSEYTNFMNLFPCHIYRDTPTSEARIYLRYSKYDENVAYVGNVGTMIRGQIALK